LVLECFWGYFFSLGKLKNAVLNIFQF